MPRLPEPLRSEVIALLKELRNAAAVERAINERWREKDIKISRRQIVREADWEHIDLKAGRPRVRPPRVRRSVRGRPAVGAEGGTRFSPYFARVQELAQQEPKLSMDAIAAIIREEFGLTSYSRQSVFKLLNPTVAQKKPET